MKLTRPGTILAISFAVTAKAAVPLHLNYYHANNATGNHPLVKVGDVNGGNGSPGGNGSSDGNGSGDNNGTGNGSDNGGSDGGFDGGNGGD